MCYSCFALAEVSQQQSRGTNTSGWSDDIEFSSLIFSLTIPPALEKDGRQDQEVSDPEQRDFCHPEQVHEVSGDRQFHGGARALLPAPHPPVTGHHLLVWTLPPCTLGREKRLSPEQLGG